MSQQGLFDELNSEMEEDDFSVSDTEYPSAFLEHPETYPILESIHIEALKAIDEIEVKLNPLTILTGPNNSGKSTILQAILLGYEGFRKCLNTNDWTLSTTGKAESEFEFIPVNQPKDLWNEKVWKPSREEEQYIRVKFQYTNGFYFTTAIRFLYGMLNIGLEEYSDDYSDELLKALASTAPILLPASNDPKSHESVMAEAQLHHLIDKENPSNLIRNILFRVQNDDESENNGEKNETSWGFIKKTIRKYFSTELGEFDFNPKQDIELRAPYQEEDYKLDIVSAGSGFNQILYLAASIAWRKPGIILMDEPDAHLHTTLQSKLLDFLNELSRKFGLQIILSTHSRDLISQAPLQSIIPVDLDRDTLKPLENVEHLLLEFERQGNISNIDLALLYQTKRCIFVEGERDSDIIPKIADQLDVDLFRPSTKSNLAVKRENQLFLFMFKFFIIRFKLFN